MMIPDRIRAIQAELTSATQAYRVARSQYVSAQVQFESARERFGAVRQFATETLTTYDWESWRHQNPDMRYAGMAIGDAIREVLRNYAYEQAHQEPEGAAIPIAGAIAPGSVPFLTLEKIAQRLEEGGFSFNSLTPGREVNAALIRQAGVRKLAEGYVIENFRAIQGEVRQWQRQQQAEQRRDR